MIGFNNNFNNVPLSVKNNNFADKNYQYSKKQGLKQDTLSLSSQQTSAKKGISSLFKNLFKEKTKEEPQQMYVLPSDFGYAQQIQYQKLGETKAHQMIKNAILNGTETQLNYHILADDEYDRIREHSAYAVDYGLKYTPFEQQNLLRVIAAQDPGDDYFNKVTYEIDGKDAFSVSVVPTKHWAWRNGTGGDLKDRVSLNVKPDSDLITELDIFMKTGEYTNANGKTSKIDDVTKFFYKTSVNIESWNNRQDPVTIYFRSDVNKETYNAICDITSRYARGYVSNSSNETPWISKIEKDPTDEMVKNLENELSTYSKNAASSLHSTFLSQSKALSSGQFQAYTNILKYLQEALA